MRRPGRSAMVRFASSTLGLAAAALLAVAIAPSWRAAAQDAAREQASAAAFRRIATVFQGPRCMNCHTLTDFPRQGDDRHRHQMNVRRGADGHGVAAQHCAACHQRVNQPKGAPGADEDWRLAPLGMGWEGLSAAELCRHLKDPARNGGRSGAAILDHLGTNLVRWAWAPGRTPAGAERTVPPLAYEEFVALARAWVDGGGACPAE